MDVWLTELLKKQNDATRMLKAFLMASEEKMNNDSSIAAVGVQT